MLLEDLRGSRVGDTVLFLGGEHRIFAAFHDHATQAQWHTLNSLLRFAGNRTGGVASERIAVVEWWRTVESLVALIYLVAVEESRAGLREGQPRLDPKHRPEFSSKWNALARWFSQEKDSPPKSLTRLVLELRDWRNSFEHSSRHSMLDIKYSRLGKVPADANLSDVMEAMTICISASALLRHIIRGLDLMPQVVVPSRRHVFYTPIDVMASDLLFPSYTCVLGTLGLTSDVQPYPLPRALLDESVVEPKLAVKGLPDAADASSPNAIDLWSSFEEFTESQPTIPHPDAFALPAYHRSV